MAASLKACQGVAYTYVVQLRLWCKHISAALLQRLCSKCSFLPSRFLQTELRRGRNLFQNIQSRTKKRKTWETFRPLRGFVSRRFLQLFLSCRSLDVFQTERKPPFSPSELRMGNRWLFIIIRKPTWSMVLHLSTISSWSLKTHCLSTSHVSVTYGEFSFNFVEYVPGWISSNEW